LRLLFCLKLKERLASLSGETMNDQPPEKQNHREDGTLAVHSIFSTIQGEGMFTGHRAIFVRLAGCNLQCPLCDTDYTSNIHWMSPESIAADILKYEQAPGRRGIEPLLVVLTGGEPFRQNIRPLIMELDARNVFVQIETNGTLYQDVGGLPNVAIVCSPKTGSINKKLAPHVDALKYVVCADDVSDADGLPLSALRHAATPHLARPPAGFKGPVYIQPADEQDPETNQKNLQAAVESVLKYGYILQLQIHKIAAVA
jgi:organic radical activating enzyme